ncbi:MAG: acyltransferase [Nitrospinae bacterium]|nr:acyltransferase [Nitrospinota bacterium]
MFGYLIAELSLRFKFNGSKAIELVSFAVFVMVVVLLAIRPRSDDILGCFMASALVMSVSYSTFFREFFSNKVSNYLGRISFPLYLIQIPVICSWSSWLFIKLPEWGVQGLLASNIILLTTIAIAILCAHLLLPVETFSIRFSKVIGRFILGKESMDESLVIFPARRKIDNQAVNIETVRNY